MQVEGVVPNMINGVSQQAPAMRLPSQGEISDNFYPLVADGNVKRPPTRHVADLIASLPETTFTHLIFRDEVEKYLLTVAPGGVVRIWDLDGSQRTVTAQDQTALNYVITGITNPREQLSALTVADHTFIVNKTMVVEESATLSPSWPFEALVNVAAGNYGKTYNIVLNGGLAASYATPDGGSAAHSYNVDTVYIASELYNDLTASLSAPTWTWGLYHSTLYIRNNSNDFTISTQDGYSGRNMKDVKREVQEFSDLPLYGPDGTVIKVIGTDNTAFDDYYVKFHKGTYASTQGVWKECIAPNTPVGLKASTMPHIIVRNNDGTFTLQRATWDERKAGDVASNPPPSFVGQKIEQMFFHRNRMGILTAENAVLSESGGFFNFYRTTMTALLDTDPIDVAAAHVKVSLLKHAVPFQDVLLLFSDRTQFRLTGDELLTPKSVSIRPLTELDSAPKVAPVVSASSVYFPATTGGSTQVYEYFMDKQFETADADAVSAHAASYIPGDVRRLVASPSLDLILVLTDAEPSSLYLYKYYWNGQEKLQSAWCRWLFDGATRIVDVGFDKTDLVLILVRNGRWFMERIACESGQHEMFHLDRRTVPTTSYDPIADRTTYTFPYNPESCILVTSPADATPGEELKVEDRTTTALICNGPPRSTYGGRVVRSRYRFSPFFVRQENGVRQDGRLQIRHLRIAHTDTAYYTVEVTPIGRPTQVYIFSSRQVDDPETRVSEMHVEDGNFSVPVLSRNDRVTIDIVSDTWAPCAFTGAEWRGTFNKGSRQQ